MNGEASRELEGRIELECYADPRTEQERRCLFNAGDGNKDGQTTSPGDFGLFGRASCGM